MAQSGRAGAMDHLHDELEALAAEVHVWRLDLDRRDALAAHERLLAPDERERAARFHFERDRVRYVNGRGALRRTLGGYLRASPSAITFEYGFAGKPALAAPRIDPALEFNLSHGQDLGLLAVTRARALGVDVERIREVPNLETLATRFFCASEARQVIERSPPDRERAFFACWTRKEAFLKAFGAGLSVPLDGFEVSVDPDRPARLLGCAWRPQELGRWSLVDVEVGERARAALALEGEPRPLRLRAFAIDEKT